MVRSYTEITRITTKGSSRNPSETAISVVLVMSSQTLLRFRNISSAGSGKSTSSRTTSTFPISVRFSVPISSHVNKVPSNEGP